MSLSEAEVLEPLHLSGKHSVVLVDDDPQVLHALRRLLRDEPYEIRATTDPLIALDWIRLGDVSLAVVDQRMPGMFGTELVEEVRRISPRTLRIMLTAYPGNALVRYALAEDVHWLVRKPWNDNALRLAIRCLLHSLEPKRPEPAPVEPDAGAAAGEGETETSRPRGGERLAGFLGRAVERAIGFVVRSTKWIVGFLWIADAGGASRWKE